MSVITNDCWNQIGVAGDRSCPELKAVILCRNCPIYANSGRSLFEREAPVISQDEWSNLLTRQKEDLEQTYQIIAPIGTISVGIFRLGREWLALPAQLWKEVTQISVIHTLPHRSNDIFLGLVNIRGEIQMCVSLSALLGLEAVDVNPKSISPHTYRRMVVVQKEETCWVFPVDEIYGLHRINPNQFANVPATVSRVSQTYTQGVVNLKDRSVSYLDMELLFHTLNKKVL